MGDDNDHNFIEITPPSLRSNVVKLSFRTVWDKKNINLSIGSEIVCSLNWNDNDLISVSYDSKYLFLKKAERSSLDDDYKLFKGYKLKKIPKSYSYSLGFHFSLMTSNKRIRIVPHEIITMSGIDYLKIYIGDLENETEIN